LTQQIEDGAKVGDEIYGCVELTMGGGQLPRFQSATLQVSEPLPGGKTETPVDFTSSNWQESSDGGQTWSAPGMVGANDSNGTVIYRLLVLSPWDTRSLLPQTPTGPWFGHNGTDTATLLAADGTGNFAFAQGNGSVTVVAQPTEVDVENMVVSDVSTVKGDGTNGTYFDFDPRGTGDLQNPEITFTIEDEGDPQALYSYAIEMWPTDGNPATDQSIDISGYITTPGAPISVFVNGSGGGIDSSQSAPLTKWGTYTFDIVATKFYSDPTMTPDQATLRSPNIWLNGDLVDGDGNEYIGHYARLVPGGNGEDVVFGYELQNWSGSPSANNPATSVSVTMLDPDFNWLNALPGQTTALRTPVVDEGVLYSLGGAAPQGVYIVLYQVLDGDAQMYREKAPRYMLVQNHRPCYVLEAGRTTLEQRLRSANTGMLGSPMNQTWMLSQKVSLAANVAAPLSVRFQESHLQASNLVGATATSPPQSSTAAPLSQEAVNFPASPVTAHSRTAQ
jgi:hypothetical protein